MASSGWSAVMALGAFDWHGVTTTTMTDPIRSQIRQILADHARLPVDVSSCADGTDLFEVGMTSHASVNVMLALEDAFHIEFSDALAERRAFASIDAIAAAISQARARAA